MLASSLREEAQMTVSNKPGHRGEREVSRKTIARGVPGDFRCDRGDYARVLCFLSHARLRVHWASGIPCALCYLRADDFAKPRAYRAAGSRMHIWRGLGNGDGLAMSRRSNEGDYAAISGGRDSARRSGG